MAQYIYPIIIIHQHLHQASVREKMIQNLIFNETVNLDVTNMLLHAHFGLARCDALQLRDSEIVWILFLCLIVRLKLF